MKARRYGREPKTRSLDQRIGEEARTLLAPFVTIPHDRAIATTPLLAPQLVHAFDSKNPAEQTAVPEDAIAIQEEPAAFGRRAFLFGVYFAPIGQETYVQQKELRDGKGTYMVSAIGTPHDPDAYRLVNGRQWLQGVEGRVYRGKLDALSVLTRQDHTVRCTADQYGRPQPLPRAAEQALLKPTNWGSTGRAVEALMRFAGHAIGRWGVQECIALPYLSPCNNRFSTAAASLDTAYAPISCPIQRIPDRIVSHQVWNAFRESGQRVLLSHAELDAMCELLPVPGTRALYKTSAQPLIAYHPEPYALRSEQAGNLPPARNLRVAS